MGTHLLALSSPVNTEHEYIQAPTIPAVHDDAGLLDRYLFDGDTDALVTLYDKHNRRLYMYCLKLLGAQEAAEDLVQEVWERVARLRARPQHVLNPTGFLLRIARNLCLNQIKARKRLTPLDDLNEGAHPAFVPHEPSELADIAIQALDSLPHDYNEVLVLNLYAGYRLDEIATMLEKSADAIRKRASRARILLRERVIELIRERGDDPNIVLSRIALDDQETGR